VFAWDWADTSSDEFSQWKRSMGDQQLSQGTHSCMWQGLTYASTDFQAALFMARPDLGCLTSGTKRQVDCRQQGRDHGMPCTCRTQDGVLNCLAAPQCVMELLGSVVFICTCTSSYTCTEWIVYVFHGTRCVTSTTCRN